MSENNLRPAVSADVYDAEWCDEMGGLGSNEIFVQTGGKIVRPRLAYALELGAVQPGMSILDIGCGRGEVLIKCMQAGAGLVGGVDYAPVPLDASRKNIEMMGFKVNSTETVLTLGCADVKYLPFEDESLDRVFMLDVVEHLYEWELQMVWREMVRLLKPDGLLIIHTLPNRWAMDYGYKMVRSMIRSLPTKVADKRDVFHINEQSVISLFDSLTKGGLNSRVWLKDQMLSQADWLQQHEITGEAAQTKIYTTLQRPVWRTLYRLAVWSSLRLLLSTDLFAVAWKSENPPDNILRRVPRAYSERLAQQLSSR